MNYNYYTQDGHLMVEGETMYRICCSEGELFNQPMSTIFTHNTGYNHLYISNDNQRNRPHLNPYKANHLHYFNKQEALKQLEFRKNNNK